MAIEAAPCGGFRWRPEGPDAVVDMFHAVRRMTYASTGSRDPGDLVRTRRGACTAKHLLLRQLLAEAGVPCRVDTLFGAFGQGLPDKAPNMPEELGAMIRAGGVPDYHNVVTATLGACEVTLDATWHDALIPIGFPVNHEWAGRGDTRLALQGTRLTERPDDPVRFKAERIAALPAADQARRLRFLALLTDYCATRS